MLPCVGGLVWGAVPFNPRGGMHPPWVILKWLPNGWSEHAEILESLWSILCPTSSKNTARVRSGLVCHKRNNLLKTRNRVFSHASCCNWLELRHYAWFRWEHDHILSLKLILTFRRSSEVTDLGRPYTYLDWLNWQFLGFHEVLRPNMWLIFTCNCL